MVTAERPRATITLPPLHDSQREIAKHSARFKVVCCGRRWGKGILGITLSVRKAAKGGRVWWVAPTYSIALEGWTYLMRLVHAFPGTKIVLSRLRVDFPGGGHIEIKTADNPDHLRGSGLDLVVLDEAASMKEEVWDLVLRPTLADRQGEAVFISTPKHRNWFFELFQRGEDPQQDVWASWQKPTWDNPFIPISEIEAARRDMLPDDFDQEFGASFTAVRGAAYPHFDRDLHIVDLPRDVRFVDGAIGVDYGRRHKSAAVAVSVDQYGRRWVREAWGEPSDDHGAELRKQIGRMRRDYAIRRARVDPNQDVLAGQLMASLAKGAEGSRQHRIALTGRLFNVFQGGRVLPLTAETNLAIPAGPYPEPDSPGLLIVRNAPGQLELCEEIEAYHFVEKETDTKQESIIARVNDDLVAALEYAIEELDDAPDWMGTIGAWAQMAGGR